MKTSDVLWTRFGLMPHWECDEEGCPQRFTGRGGDAANSAKRHVAQTGHTVFMEKVERTRFYLPMHRGQAGSEALQ